MDNENININNNIIKKKEYKCIDCNNRVNKKIIKRCKNCNNKHRFETISNNNRPPYEQLKKQ